MLSTPENIPFTVGALNTTQVLSTNTYSLPYNLSNSFLKLNITATGTLPNTNKPRIFKHEYIFHDLYLNKVDLQDPGLKLNYDQQTGNFTVEATKGVAAWVWLDLPAGTLGNFEENGFWLLPSDGLREVGIKVKNNTNGQEWVNEVTVRSLWDNTLT